MGHPYYLPTIDGSEIIRDFRVTAGGRLDLQYVRLNQGAGSIRERYGMEGRESTSTVAEIKGGGVLFEAGAEGGSFVGVIFLALLDTPVSVKANIENTRNGVGGRTYGGHVYLVSGRVDFINCIIYDSFLLIAFTDQFDFGTDMLILGGEAYFTNCIFHAFLGIGSYEGQGQIIAIFAGIAVFTNTHIQLFMGASNAVGAGLLSFSGGEC